MRVRLKWWRAIFMVRTPMRWAADDHAGFCGSTSADRCAVDENLVVGIFGVVIVQEQPGGFDGPAGAPVRDGSRPD